MLLGDVTGQWHGIQSGAANGGIGQQGIDIVGAFAPTLRQSRIFHDGQHQADITYLLDFDRAHRASDERRRRHGAGGAERLAGQLLNGRTDRYIAQWRRRGIYAFISPTGLLRQTQGNGFGGSVPALQRLQQPGFGVGRGRAGEGFHHQIGALQPNGEMLSGTKMV